MSFTRLVLLAGALVLALGGAQAQSPEPLLRAAADAPTTRAIALDPAARLLSCRPLAAPGVTHPRPPGLWPVDALVLAEELLTQAAAACRKK